MGIVTEVTIPSSDFELGRSVQRVGDVHVMFEQVVPTGGGLFPSMWVYADDHTEFCQVAQTNDAVANLRLVYREHQRGLYDVTWEAETEQFLSCLRRTTPTVLEAGGDAGGWKFGLRFHSNDAVSEFQRECTRADITLTVDRLVTKSAVDPPGEKLTEPQRETVQIALERGYFDVPRETTMVELAEELGISDQAVSARIRRAMKKLSQQLMIPETSDGRDGLSAERPTITHR